MSEATTVFHAGPWAEFSKYVFQPRPDFGLKGKLFLQKHLQLQGSEVSLNAVPPGGSMPFFHYHTNNEELYVFVSGSGEMIVDDQRIAVSEGSAVRISPRGIRTLRNSSNTPLCYLCIQYRQTDQLVSEGSDGKLSDRPVVW